jgi:hypothetical protein
MLKRVSATGHLETQTSDRTIAIPMLLRHNNVVMQMQSGSSVSPHAEVA